MYLHGHIYIYFYILKGKNGPKLEFSKVSLDVHKLQTFGPSSFMLHINLLFYATVQIYAEVDLKVYNFNCHT